MEIENINGTEIDENAERKKRNLCLLIFIILLLVMMLPASLALIAIF